MKFRCLVVLFVCLYLTNEVQSKTCKPPLIFVSREQWGAREPLKRVALTVPVDFVVVHHTATPPCINNCTALMRAIQNEHIDNNSWDDIGYNFLIGGDEKVYIGRGWTTVGTHAGSVFYNEHSVGIAIIGNYNDVLPSARVLKILNSLIERGIKLGYVSSQYVLRGHRDVRETGSTECPGDALYAEIQTWPHYN